MNALRITGIILIILVTVELLNSVAYYTFGRMKLWPFGVEVGAGLLIWLGLFLVKRGNKQTKQLK